MDLSPGSQDGAVWIDTVSSPVNLDQITEVLFPQLETKLI